MIDIIYVKDVFAEHPETHVISKPYIAGMTLNGYADLTDRDAYVAGMWAKHPETFCPKDGMQVLVVPHVAGHGFKKFLGTVLTVGLLIAAPHWTFGITSLWARSLVTGAVLILGGKIINSVFHLNQTASRGVDDRSSTTYGWDLPSVQTQEGNVIGETFGECIPSPQLLMCHVETADENTQYLNVLYCGGYGPVDSIKDIRIEHTPIENFSDCQIETRLGTNDQTAISFFPDTVADQSIDLTLKEGVAVIRSTDSDEVNKLEVTVTFPSGIYYQKDDGNLGNLEVKFNIAYRVTGTSNWIGSDYALSRATNQSVRKVYTFSGLAANRYDVKVTPITTPITSRSCGLMQWSTLSSYSFTGAFTRPNKVLVGMRVKATSQLNGGVPSINWRQRRTVGYIWDPNKQEYVTKDLRNPIWAAYDILHHCRRLYNVNTGAYEYHVDGCPKERFTQYFDQWAAAADYADEEVTNADGSKEPRFRFDAYYDTSLRRYEAANKALAVGHATLVRHGLQLGVVVDKPGTIHQVFGEGRTIASSIKGEFSATEDRAHSLEVTYNDTENDFKNTEFFIRSDSYASAAANGQDNTAQLTLFGVSSRSQAYREAMYALATNERQLQTIQFSADVNAFVCEYGDLIGINSQVPRLGVASGRVVSVDGTQVKLDKTVTFAKDESYTIMIQLSASDTIVTRDVTAFTAETTTDTLAVAKSFDTGSAPAAFDNYALGLKDKAVKPFRITKIERDGEQKVAITAVEYDKAIYSVDYSKYPKIDYSTQPTLKAPINLKLVEQIYKNPVGDSVDSICVTWDVPDNTKYDEFHVYYSADGGTWILATSVYNNSATIDGVMAPHTYLVKVCAVLDGVESKAVQANIKTTGVDLPPDDVEVLNVEKLASGTRRYWWKFTYPDPNDIAGFRIKYTQGKELNWDTGIPAQDGLVTTQPYEARTIRQGTHAVMIKAVDNNGNESVNFAYCLLDMGDLLQENVLYDKDFKTSSSADLPNNGVVLSDGYIHAINSEKMWHEKGRKFWSTAAAKMWDSSFQSYIASGEFIAPASGQFWLETDIEGPAVVYYRIDLADAAWVESQENAPVWDSDETVVWDETNDLWKQWSDKVQVRAGAIIQIRIVAKNSSMQETIIKGLHAYIDVPDRQEHFEDLEVPATGLELPITTPNYYTTAVHIDSVQSGTVQRFPKILSRTPCRIALLDASGNQVAGTVDITWQGFVNETM